MLKTYFIIAVALILTISTSASAQNCDGLLKPDTAAMSSNTALAIAFKSIQTRESYQGLDASYKDGSTSYDGFYQNNEKTKAETGYNYDLKQSQWFYANRINPENAKIFLDCVNVFDLKLSVRFMSSETAILEVFWNAPPETNSAAKLVFNVKGGTAAGPMPNEIPARAKRTLQFTREKNSELTVVVNSELRTAFIFDPKPLTLREARPPQSRPLQSALVGGRMCEVIFDNSPVDDHLGTIARGTPYSIRYSSSDGKYTSRGYAVGGGPGNVREATYPGPHPSTGSFDIFGARFNFTESGTVTSDGITNVGIKLTGKMRCVSG